MSTTPSSEALAVAKKMAKAAGRVSPETLAGAALMLIDLACITKNPDKWVEMKIAQEDTE